MIQVKYIGALELGALCYYKGNVITFTGNRNCVKDFKTLIATGELYRKPKTIDMEYTKRLSAIERKVCHVLNDYPDTRNNTILLIYKVWSDESKGDADVIRKMKIGGGLTEPETITRSKRTVVDLYPQLRKIEKDEGYGTGRLW